MRKAAALFMPACLLWVGCVQNSPPVELLFDFRRSQFDGLQLKVLGPEMTRMMTVQESGLLMDIPAGGGAKEVTFSPQVGLEGDFEIVATYEIVKIASPDGGYGVGPRVYVATASRQENAATIARMRRADKKDVYSAHSAHSIFTDTRERRRQNDGYTVATTAAAGQLCLRRIGNELQYLVSDNERGMLTEIRKIPFTDADVRSIRVGLDRGGAATAAGVRWKDLAIRAHAFTTQRTVSSWDALLGAAVLLALLLATTAWHWWSRGTVVALTESGEKGEVEEDAPRMAD